jgi:hypothetical protein
MDSLVYLFVLQNMKRLLLLLGLVLQKSYGERVVWWYACIVAAILFH